jgi:hypothetical protein
LETLWTKCCGTYTKYIYIPAYDLDQSTTPDVVRISKESSISARLNMKYLVYLIEYPNYERRMFRCDVTALVIHSRATGVQPKILASLASSAKRPDREPPKA